MAKPYSYSGNATVGQGGDEVNHPPHYAGDGIECIDAIRAALGDEYGAYCRGNIIKYVWRYADKDGIKDLRKSEWYIRDLIAWEEVRSEASKIARAAARRLEAMGS